MGMIGVIAAIMFDYPNNKLKLKVNGINFNYKVNKLIYNLIKQLNS